MRILRTDSSHPDFIALVDLLDAELAERDGQDHLFYSQFNHISALKHTLIAYEGITPIACGAIKHFDNHSVEVKRMFTIKEKRGLGIAARVLRELEHWANELGYQKCVLETGKRQPEAISLYQKSGYSIISNYGQYAGIENSVCFEKTLTAD